MGCACGTSSSNTYIPRRYMRIDGLIFDKKYVSKLDFEGDTLYLYRKGDCCAYKYKMYSEKTKNQITEYLLELNTCDDEQVDMSTDDHSKLMNLDLEDQHPISSIIGLRDELNNVSHKIVVTNPQLDSENNKCVWEIEHTFGADVLVLVKNSDGKVIYPDIVESNNLLVITFDSQESILEGTFKVIIVG